MSLANDKCPSILFLMTDETMRRLQVIQNKAMRVILKVSIYTPVREMLSVTKLMSVKQRIYFNVLLMMYKIKLNMAPKYLTQNLCKVSEAQPYQLRNNELYRLPNLISASAQNSLFYKGTKMLNEFLKTKKCIGIYTKDMMIIEKFVLENY